MKKITSKFNLNWISVVILLGAFIFSAVRFYHISSDGSSGEGEKKANTIIVAHWQLEPGFRDALQWAMDQYNELPHVQEAGIRIEQSAIPQKVYNQFMNVHLISGTAPDIAVNGSAISQGSALAKFFSPLGNYVEQPNPYNQPEYLPENMPEEQADYLANASWKDTFFDGMLGGYQVTLDDYYGVPICTFGGARMFYNLDILHKVKAFALEQSQLSPEPAWLTPLWRSPTNPKGYLPREDAVLWLENESIPQSLGQLFFYCKATLAYAQSQEDVYLVPIAASSYNSNDISSAYELSFFTTDWENITMELGTQLSGLETVLAFSRNIWNFQSPYIQSYFELCTELTEFYPNGYLGLDREQAQRRFVLGQAAMIHTGAWDAPGIFSGVENRDNPEDIFEVKVARPPLPKEGERWSEFIRMLRTEANTRGGVPFAINKQTQHFDWALDFLRFLTSHPINETFNQHSGWLPVIVGAKPPEKIGAFAPDPEGIPGHLAMNIDGNTGLPATLRNAWTSNVKLYMSGDLPYDELKSRVEIAFESPAIGIRKVWPYYKQKLEDRSRAQQKSISIERIHALNGSEESEARERAATFQNLLQDEGVQVLRWWHELHPGEPFPEY